MSTEKETPSSKERTIENASRSSAFWKAETIAANDHIRQLREALIHVLDVVSPHDKDRCAACQRASRLITEEYSPDETTDHIANEWADMATNGIVWLRNIRDGISTPVEALTEMESNLQRIQKLRAVEPTGVLPPAFQSLLDLQPNWDSYGAKRINPACVQKAYEIWRQLAGIWLPVPHSDGTVGLEQHQGGFDIEIDVDLSLPPEKSSESSPVLDHRFIPEGMDPGICQKCGATRASHRDTREGIVFAEEAAESSPDQLVGALQDRVHQDLGRVRAGRSVKASGEQS